MSANGGGRSHRFEIKRGVLVLPVGAGRPLELFTCARLECPCGHPVCCTLRYITPQPVIETEMRIQHAEGPHVSPPKLKSTHLNFLTTFLFRDLSMLPCIKPTTALLLGQANCLPIVLQFCSYLTHYGGSVNIESSRPEPNLKSNERE